MKHYFLVLLICILSACASTASEVDNSVDLEQPAISLAEYCATSACRENHTVKFLTDGGEVEQLIELYWPVVQGEQISLLPGDVVYIEAEMVDGIFTNFKQVDTPLHPDRTVVFDFSQMEGKVDMMLSVKNPFDKIMKFHLDMIDFEGNAHQTSSCPVIAGGSVYEMWPHPIPELIVSNIRALEASGEMICIY